jgi:hypothetical protein
MNPFFDLSGLRHCSPLNTFTLLHRGTPFPVNPTLLSIASPKISRLLSVNPSLSEYILPPISGPIKHFISILFGEAIEINVVNCRFFAYLARDLEIRTLEEATLGVVTGSNTFGRVTAFANELLELGLPADIEVRQLAQNCKELIAQGAIEWPPNVLRAVLLSEFLEMSDYAQLVRNAVLPLLRKGPQNADLIDGLRFVNLDNETIKAILGETFVDVNRVRPIAAQILAGKVIVNA